MSCKGGFERHWFVYRGTVGSSAPTCQRIGCDAPNPHYDPDRDFDLNRRPKAADR